MTGNVGAGFVSDFKALSTKQIIAIVVALVVSLALHVMGFSTSTCMGFLIVAVFLYMIPHLLGVASVRVKTVVGVVFVIVSILIGTFAYGDMDERYASHNDSNSIKDINVEFMDGEYVLTYSVNPSATEIDSEWGVVLQHGEVSATSYGMVYKLDDLDTERVPPTDLTADGTGWYAGTETLTNLDDGELGYIYIGIYVPGADGEKEQIKAYTAFTYDAGISSSGVIELNFMGALYTTAMVALLFFVILGFSAIMRRSAQKTRSRMEADGRLYPQGYGRCKSCGAMVLPGEVVCRKCGEYIEVPEELRVQKKDFFTCSECGYEVPASATVCPKCGATFDEVDEVEVEHVDGTIEVTDEVVSCPSCGQDIPANADWCPKCGKKIKG